MISIILPVYNSEKYLSESIQSMLDQTYTDFEFIIINDGSVDTSEEIILSFNDQRIRYYKNEVNKGLIFTLNKGIELSKREYIARMDADDIAYPSRLELQLQFLSNNLDYGVCGSLVRIINENGKQAEILNLPICDEEIKAYLYFSPALNHPSVMIRAWLLKNNLYSKDFKTAEDYELWIRLSSKTKFYNIPQVLIKYRIHSGNISKTDVRQAENSITLLLNSFIAPQLTNKTLIDIYIKFVLRKQDISIKDYNKWLADFTKELLFKNHLFVKYFIKRWFGLCISTGNYRYLIFNNISKIKPMLYYSSMIKYAFNTIKDGFPNSLK